MTGPMQGAGVLGKYLNADQLKAHGTLKAAAAAYMEHVTSLACDHSGAMAGTHTSCPQALALNAALVEPVAGAIPGLPVNWPSPSTDTPNVDKHPLEHYWSDRMTEPRPEDVERLARWLEEDIQANAGTEFAYRAWARELLLRLSIKP